jgi:MFS family permease
MMAVYARILRTPRIAVLIGAVVLTRLPFAINALAVVLFIREETGSFGIAGLVSGALALGAAAGSPFASRLVDRRGARMLVPLAAVHAAAVVAIWALGSAGAPSAATAFAALVAGASFPPAGAVLRSRYADLIGDPELVHGAYALDSVTIELAFVTGPLLTALVVAVVGPAYALWLSAALALAGTTLFQARMPDDGPHPASGAHRGFLGALAEPGVRMLALSTAPVGFCIGAIEVALPAFSTEAGSAALAGILLALWSAASGVGGLLYGARPPRGGALRSFFIFALVFPLASLPLAAASSPAVMAALVVLAGIPIAPLIASRNQILGGLAPGGTGAESFTWLMTALVTGLAAGNAVSGAVVEGEGWPAAVVLGCIVGAAGAAIAYAWRGALRPQVATG